MDDANKTSDLAPMPDLSGAIEKLLAHPELLASVASVLGKPPPVGEAKPQEEEAVASSEAETLPSQISPEAISTLAPLLGSFGKNGGKFTPPPRADDPRACLLLALKPYLSAGRCEAIDTMIRFSAISELLRGRTEKNFGGH